MKKYLLLLISLILINSFAWINQASALMACHTWEPNMHGNDVISVPSAVCCSAYAEFNPSCPSPTCEIQNGTWLNILDPDLAINTCVVVSCDDWYVQSGQTCVTAPIAWICLTTSIGCDTWTYVDLDDTTTEYKWQCAGEFNGNNASCSRTIPVIPENGVCGSNKNSCNLWTVIDKIDGSTEYTWKCEWTNLGNTASCSEIKIPTIPATPPVGNWPVSWGGTAIDWLKFSWMNNETLYKLKWCPAHKTDNGPCDSTKQFTKKVVGTNTIATLPINGWSDDLPIIFNNMDFEIIWEGVLTIDTFAMDNAHNISKKKFIYKVDKTAPRFWNFVFTEESLKQYINIESHTGTPPWIWPFHVSTENDEITFPALASYVDATPGERVYNQTNVSKVRYKQNGVIWWVPVINVTLDWSTDTYWGQANYNHVSRLGKIEFYRWNSVLPTAWSEDYYKYKDIDLTTEISGQKELDLNTFDFTKSWNIWPSWDLASNTWAFINVRLTDYSWNYSEKAFYVYRDETTPDLSKFAFDFSGNTDGHELKESWELYSRFLLANESTFMDYDWWTTNDHMATGIVMEVENQVISDPKQSINLSLATNWTSSKIELNNVDANFKSTNTGKNYREYPVTFKTPWINWNYLCDAAGNCVDGADVFTNFRVIAAAVNNNTSNLTIGLPSSNTPKTAIANNPGNAGIDEYEIWYNLKDKYWNTIRQVYDWVSQIKKVTAKFNFENGLTQNFTPSELWDTSNSEAVTIDIPWSQTKITDDINEVISKIVLEENKTSSDWVIDFTLSSQVPTFGWYKYMKDTAQLNLETINNEVVYGPKAKIYNAAYENNTDDYRLGTNNWLTINSQIFEDPSNRYNLNTDLSTYWELTWSYINTPLSSNLEKLNFEFWSPFVYTAENFNILRDGIDSKHTKKLVDKIWGNSVWISDYTLKEKYFDINDKYANNNTYFYLADNKIYNSVGNGIQTHIKWSIKDKDFRVRYNALLNRNFDKWGYVSYLKYDAWTYMTVIPSISRWIQSASGSASAYYPTVVSWTWTSFLTEDIAISGLVNEIEWWANTSVKPGQVSLDMKRPYTRAELLQKVKRKMFSVSRGLDWCAPSTDINVTNPDPDCTTTINGEHITFYTWPITIPAASINDRRAIIVKDGRVSITWDLSTSSNGQLLIVSVTEKWLSNIKINSSDNNIKADLQKWWITINEEVTNVDAFLLAQWPLVTSFTSDNYVFKNYKLDDKLLNQLHIYGSVFSLNTIGWSKTWECPYIEETCWDEDTAKIYDLSFLRRYTRVDAGNFGWDNWSFVPYDPSLQLDKTQILETSAKSSGWLQYYWDWVPSSTTTLRTARTDHENAPVIVERDNRWTTSPSFFAKD